MALDIYGIGVLITAIAAVVFLIKSDKDKALISIIIFLVIMLLKFIGV